jgi:hypothetical protein
MRNKSFNCCYYYSSCYVVIAVFLFGRMIGEDFNNMVEGISISSGNSNSNSNGNNNIMYAVNAQVPQETPELTNNTPAPEQTNDSASERVALNY